MNASNQSSRNIGQYNNKNMNISNKKRKNLIFRDKERRRSIIFRKNSHFLWNKWNKSNFYKMVILKMKQYINGLEFLNLLISLRL